MTTYIYETIPQKDGEAVKHYEIKQSMTDPALARHPETGDPIRRVIVAGYGVLKSGGETESPSSSCGCGPEGCCG